MQATMLSAGAECVGWAGCDRAHQPASAEWGGWLRNCRLQRAVGIAECRWQLLVRPVTPGIAVAKRLASLSIAQPVRRRPACRSLTSCPPPLCPHCVLRRFSGLRHRATNVLRCRGCRFICNYNGDATFYPLQSAASSPPTTIIPVCAFCPPRGAFPVMAGPCCKRFLSIIAPDRAVPCAPLCSKCRSVRLLAGSEQQKDDSSRVALAANIYRDLAHLAGPRPRVCSRWAAAYLRYRSSHAPIVPLKSKCQQAHALSAPPVLFN